MAGVCCSHLPGIATPELYVVDVKKGTVKRITRSLAVEDQGTFDAKGKQIAFRSNRFRAHGIYTSKLSGAGCERILPVEIGEEWIECGRPAFSRNGKQLAFLQMVGGVPRLAIADLKSGEILRPLEASGGEDSVAWAGKRLAYTSQRDQERDLFLADATGSEETNLTPGQAGTWDIDASTSRAGKRIAFARWLDGQCDIWVVGADGNDLKRLTNSKAQDRRPRFSPDGDRIVFDRSPRRRGRPALDHGQRWRRPSAAANEWWLSDLWLRVPSANLAQRSPCSLVWCLRKFGHAGKSGPLALAGGDCRNRLVL